MIADVVNIQINFLEKCPRSVKKIAQTWSTKIIPLSCSPGILMLAVGPLTEEGILVR